MNARAELLSAFLTRTGWQDATRTVVAGDASNRRYDRLTDQSGHSVILMDAPPDKGEDVTPFIRIANHLRAQGLSAPEILHADQANGFLVIEDLGNGLFARLMQEERQLQSSLYSAATDVLTALHQSPALDLPRCDADWLINMTDLFFEWFLPAQSDLDHTTFASAFRPLAQSVDPDDPVVILRDYHAENLIWLPNRTGVARVGLLDFQDALLGHPAYDLVSVLQDARRDVPQQIEADMISRYIDTAGWETDAFNRAYAILGTQRNLRILGIFARLCLRDGKAHYVDLIPRVWTHLMRNLNHPALHDIARLIRPHIPDPTEPFLKSLKSRCPTRPAH